MLGQLTDWVSAIIEWTTIRSMWGILLLWEVANAIAFCSVFGPGIPGEYINA